MVIVPLKGDIFRANVQSYIVLEWGQGFEAHWKPFLENSLGEGIRFIRNNGEEIAGDSAYKLHSNILRLVPSFNMPGYQTLKYIYFLRKDGSLRIRLITALDALDNVGTTSVAFNGDHARDDQAVVNTGRIIESWEREKLEKQEPVNIKQVSLVCPEDYFIRLIPWQEPLIVPVFRPLKWRC